MRKNRDIRLTFNFFKYYLKFYNYLIQQWFTVRSIQFIHSILIIIQFLMYIQQSNLNNYQKGSTIKSINTFIQHQHSQIIQKNRMHQDEKESVQKFQENVVEPSLKKIEQIKQQNEGMQIQDLRITLKRIDQEVNEESKDKSNKKKTIKNKKCSICHKKKLGRDIISCKNCPKMYHVQCLGYEIQKTQKKYLCQKCKILLKQKQLKKKIKATKKQQKMIQKYNNENKNNQKQIIQVLKNSSIVIDSQTQKQRLLSSFASKYPYYTLKNKIIFPIQDDLFDEYSSIFPKSLIISKKPQPTQFLPKYFGTILELWNTVQTFSEYFPDEKDLTINDFQAALEYTSKNLIFIQNMYVHMLNFTLRDIFNERFQMNKQYTGNPFLSLLRYCSQNNAFDRIFRFVWIEYLNQISTIPQFQNMFKNNLNFNNLINKLKNKSNQLWMPSQIEDRIQLTQTLLSGIIDTSSFHDMLYQKIDQGRQNNRQRNEYQESIKQQQNFISSKKQIQRNLEKQIKQKQKILDSANDRQNKPKIQKQLQKAISQLQKINQQKQQSIKNIEIYKQNIEFLSNTSTHTNIWLIGQDKQKNQYWFILDQRDKLFVHTQKNQWFFYDYYKLINELPKSLNTKGVRQKQLYETLMNYKKSNYFYATDMLQKHGQKSIQMIFELQKKYEQEIRQYQLSGQFDYDKEKWISFPLIKKMLEEGEKKIFSYLEQRNARWATPQDRQIYIQNIRNATELQEILEAVKHLNQKICVVQIQYKYIIQDENNQQAPTIDSKTRKIQTKMWGINEKYKHAWLQYAKNCKSLLELFFLVAIIFLTIERYVKKMRETRKLKKQIEQIKVLKKNKILNKTQTGQNKDIDAAQWDEYCHICKKWGQLLCCDFCPKVFHLECIGLPEIPEGQYKCKECEQKRQTRSKTKKIVNVHPNK